MHPEGWGSRAMCSVVQAAKLRLSLLQPLPQPCLQRVPAKKWLHRCRARNMKTQASGGVNPAVVKASSTVVGEEEEEGEKGYKYDWEEDEEELEDGEEGVPTYRGRTTFPGPYQQTLWRSFVICGIGLHTAEQSCVRVRPAFAGEGRYFVRVPSGTNKGLYEEQIARQTTRTQVHPQPTPDPDEETEDDMAMCYLSYLKGREEGSVKGAFMNYAVEAGVLGPAEPRPLDEDHEDFETQERSDDEEYVIANIDNVNPVHLPLCVCLGEGENMVQSVEHLLSALEACGVDNARIEIEGGPEVPVVDGSAMGWVQEISIAGVAAATCIVDKEHVKVRRSAIKVKEIMSVQNGSQSITVIPDNCMRISYTLHSDNPVIGKQWYTWCLQDDFDHYYTAISPAKPFVPSLKELYDMRNKGYFRAGSEGILLVGDDEGGWFQHDLVQYSEEPARHKIIDLIGDLSLLSLAGMSGLPYGHIIAFNADHSLHLKLVKALKEMADVDYYEGYRPDPTAPLDPDEED